MLAVFDFDQTIINGDSDAAARGLIDPPNLIPDRQNFPDWTQYMQQVFNTIKNINISAEKILDVVSSLNPIVGMPEVMKEFYKNNVEIIVASDSNSLFIHNWLKRNKLSRIISCIYTNPAEIVDGLIKIEPYTLQRTCGSCTKNMCKGTIVKEHKLKSNKVYSKTFYFGDGKNDLCPVMKLTPNDIAFPRSGYTLDNLLKSHAAQADVIPWCTGNDIYEYLKSIELIPYETNYK